MADIKTTEKRTLSEEGTAIKMSSKAPGNEIIIKHYFYGAPSGSATMAVTGNIGKAIAADDSGLGKDPILTIGDHRYIQCMAVCVGECTWPIIGENPIIHENIAALKSDVTALRAEVAKVIANQAKVIETVERMAKR